MTYTKPSLTILGAAPHAIRFLGKPSGGSLDPNPPFGMMDPAYDLDD
jgi:hypothetical protein